MDTRDLQWVLQAIKSETISFDNIFISLSQPTSGCYQETESSININISKDNLFYFSDILTTLATAERTHSSLQNLEFHQVEWELKDLQNLKALLESNSNIKQLVFQRNRFDEEGLFELSDFLKKNGMLKVVMFSESGIGSVGAGLLASALMINNVLEELQIWDDSIGSKGAEELSKMIEVNSTLKLLTIFDTSSNIIATPLISAVLARNRMMELHVWIAENNEKISKILEFVPENNTLRIYNIDETGSCKVACALSWNSTVKSLGMTCVKLKSPWANPGSCRVANALNLNSTVKSLDMTGVKLKTRWAKEFRWVLEQNHTLKEVRLSKTCLKDKGVVYVTAGLFKNKSLESLYLDGNWFNGIGIEHLLTPLSKFSAFQNQANITLKTVTFGGGKIVIGTEGLAAILQFLTTNQSVARLGIYDDVSLKQVDFIKIFKSLEKNVTLRYLSVKGCKGVAGDLVLRTIIETLQVNPWIEEIDLTRTPLQISGKTNEIHTKLEQNGRTEPQMDLLNDMKMTMPRNCRVFFCGHEYAGKTTLRNSVSTKFLSSKLPYIDQVRTLVQPVEEVVKSEGIKIKTLKDDTNKISIWNIAGQHEFYPLHDLMFPGHASASCFFIITSLFRKPQNKEPKNVTEVVEDVQYWLRFIVSNSKKAVKQCMLPNVTIVLTNIDKINQTSESFQVIVHSIQRLKDKFKGYVDFYPTIFTVDARSSVSVSMLAHHLRKTSNTVLQRVPQVYELCNELTQIISEWRFNNHNRPTMNWKEFNELCQIKVPPLRTRSRHDYNNNKEKVEMKRRTIATCLHQIGEVIYFDELGFFILDIAWFCGEVFGQLISLDVKKQISTDKNIFSTKKELEKILSKNLQSQIPGIGFKLFENFKVGDLVRMMLKMEFCYQQDLSDPNSLILIPSILEDGRARTQKWQLRTSDCIYVGRHLECDDSSHMFLTSDFFPRLQVHLHNKIIGTDNQHGAAYSLEKYLISININGIYVRVELGGQLGHHIDVLACSTKNLTETLRFIQQLIIPAIHSLCHGVTLTENILRPECVRNLTPPRFRKTQYICIQKLKHALLSVPADNMYNYQHTWGPVLDSGRHVLGHGFDYARDLLSDDDFREVLHRRYHDLYNLAQELQVLPENNQDNAVSTEEKEASNKVEPTFWGIAKGVEQVLNRLKIIEQEIRDLKQEIQGLRHYEHKLLIELNRKMSFLTSYNINLEERKVPNMFFFVNTDNYSRILVTNMISGMTALRLHMLCEFRGEMHVVEDQRGCELMQVDNMAVKSLAPYMKKFMKLLTFALKIGAHLAAGMGEMIPDLSREVSYLVNSSSLAYGAAGDAAAGTVGVVAAGTVGVVAAGAVGSMVVEVRQSSRDIQQEQRAAQQWLVDFLREQRCSSGKDIAEKFALWRVRYRDSGHIAWICNRHMNNRAHEIIELPV